MLIVYPRFLAILLGRDHSLCPAALDHIHHFVTVVALVPDYRLGFESVDQRLGLFDVRLLAPSQNESERVAQSVDGSVNLGAESTAGSAQRLLCLPPFLPAAC